MVCFVVVAVVVVVVFWRLFVCGDPGSETK